MDIRRLWHDQGRLASPSFLSDGKECESALTLPVLAIEPGEWLYWKSRAVYPIKSELHTAEIRRKGEDKWTILDEISDSGNVWTQHMADLSDFASSECEIRFVCRSKSGYMLALNAIKISAPADFSFEASNKTSKFFGLDEVVDECVPIDFSVRNLGKELAGTAVALTADGEEVAEVAADFYTGETKTFSLPLPISLNERTDYQIVIKNSDGSGQTLDESFAFLSSIKRYMLVDKGTGMWCNNCPVGTLDIENLEQTYGESLITVETHNGDPLANDVYFNWLGYRAIPRLELDRIKSSAGESDKYFKDFICQPTDMGISVQDIVYNADGTLDVSAEVTASEQFADSGLAYRIGYVLTRDVDGSENMQYYQSNNCAIPNYNQYYYLPSVIIAPLCFFPNSSLPSPVASNSNDPAFTGMEGSLPESLNPGQTYVTNWNIPLPIGYSDFGGMRLVAYILDAKSRKVINTTIAYIDDYSRIESIRSDMPSTLTDDTIYSLDGKALGTSTEGLASGIYVVNGKKVKL